MRRPLLLNGFMATGKSSVGRKLAELTGSPFVDLDAEIEARAQTSVATIFKERGEQAFRKLEQEELVRVLGGWRDRLGLPPVVALGGGALLQRSTRVDALNQAVVVTLTATPETIARRVSVHSGRPLLDGEDVRERAESLLALRERSYLEAHAVLATDAESVEALAQRALEVWKDDPIAVAAEEASHVVQVGHGILAARLPGIVKGFTNTLLVTDRNVFPLHGRGLLESLRQNAPTGLCELEPGEPHKDVQSLSQIWDACHAQTLDRKSIIVALGGGVVTDMAGFAAATWMRGIAWAGLPTTLLSMVDASVGGKTAIDYKDAKNSVGAFCHPRRVLCDIDVLATEPQRGFVSGLAEVVKTAIIGDEELFEICKTQAASILTRDPACIEDIVRRCIRVKANVVSVDQKESGVRATLNLGHTIGHALESDAGYGVLAHGEAVSLGLVAALRIGERLGATPSSLTREVESVLRQLNLPTALDRAQLESAIALIGRDKKRTGAQLRFVVAKGVGAVQSVMLPLAELERMTAELAASLS
ncbi:MAG: 3-dehydroquinate synthase [Polyangiaceae bacterium]|nr:3-dehydroquinate synthase [Polyangiaceae bacterium]